MASVQMKPNNSISDYGLYAIQNAVYVVVVFKLSLSCVKYIIYLVTENTIF